jgi:hypothetical protein
MTSLQFGSATAKLSFALDDSAMTDAPDAQPAHVFGVGDAGHDDVLAVGLAAS